MLDDIFKDEPRPAVDEKIVCASPACKDPVSASSIEKFTYLDECLHAICLFCLRDYVRKNYVSLKGEMRCPAAECGCVIPEVQVRQVMDASVLLRLESELNSRSLDLIECQKCHEHYQFEKGKPADAPKKNHEGTPPLIQERTLLPPWPSTTPSTASSATSAGPSSASPAGRCPTTWASPARTSRSTSRRGTDGVS